MHMVQMQTMERPPLGRSEHLTFAVLSDGEETRRPKVQVRLESSFIGPVSFWNGNALHDLFISSSFSVTHIHIQVANQASQVYPSVASSSVPSEITGPSGILIQVEYNTSEGVTGNRRVAFSSSAFLRQYFLNTTLPHLVGSRRVVTAPLGSSMSLRRLHRMVHCQEQEHDAAIVQCTALLPSEGAHAAFSVEGFRTFLQPAPRAAGIWSVATPAEWSQWFIGSGHAISETVPEAANHWSQSAGQLASSSSRQLVDRRVYWIDWRKSMVATEEHHGSPVVSTQYGVQYTVQLARSSDASNVHHKDVSLNDLLPPSTESFLQPDPFADASTIQVIPSSSLSSIEWGEACGPTSQKTRKEEWMRSHFVGITTIARTLPCFMLLWGVDEDSTKSEIVAPANYWSLYTHVQRPHSGQAYRGTLMGQVQNRLSNCGTLVRLQQWVPGVVEPVWQSLRIEVVSHVNTGSVDARFVSIQEAGYQVEFLENGSFIWQLQYIVPPQSQLEWRLDYEPSFLSIDEFPGDANRGFEIPPAYADFHVQLDGSDECHAVLEQTLRPNAPFGVRLYSNAVLILAPLPDRSMPFNVLSFTCTFYVFVIGSLMNLMVKKVSTQMKSALEGKKESKIQLLLKKIRTKFERFTARKQQQQQNEPIGESKDE